MNIIFKEILMKFFYLLILILGCNTLCFAQGSDECSFQNKQISQIPGKNSITKLPKNLADFEPVTFNIYFWGFRLEDNAGNVAFTQENIEAAVERLNTLYNQCNIAFNLLGHEVILSNEFYTLIGSQSFQGMIDAMIVAGKIRSDAFNVYVSNEYSGFAGIALDYYGTILGISSINLISSGTLEHEVGHCFNLLHTNETNNTLNCESVVRDPNSQYYNADISGDFVADTAAGYAFEPEEVDATTCTLNSSKKDCYGFTYKIPSSLLRNYMTIKVSECTKDQLTNGQFIRIRNAIELDPFDHFQNARID